MVKILFGLYASSSELGAMLISIFWCLFNCVVLFLSLYDVLKRLYNRRDHRFPVHIEVQITDEGGNVCTGVVHDISQSGVGVHFSERTPLSGDIRIRLALPNGPLDLNGTVAYSKPVGGGTFAGMRFSELTEAQKATLFYFLFVTVPRQLYSEQQPVRRHTGETITRP